MTPASLPDGIIIHYQVPRKVLLGIWTRRMFWLPRRLLVFFLLAVAGGLFWLSMPELKLLVLIFYPCLLLATAIRIYRNVGRAIDDHRHLTDPRTLECNASRLIITGPDWRSELPWTTFLGFSEDDAYFYLHQSSDGIASVLPKASFAPTQQEKFRSWAKAVRA